MIQLNPRYEAILNPDNIDQDSDRIASLMNVEADFIKEALDAGLYKQAIRITSSILLQTSSFIHSTMVSFYVQKENVNYVARHNIKNRYEWGRILSGSLIRQKRFNNLIILPLL